MTAPSLAEIIADGEKLEDEHDRAVRAGFDATAHALWDEKCSFWDDHARALLAVARAARDLFRALDNATPGWREDTCIIDENSDEVNVAWCGLENALDNPKAGQPPEAF